jgi:hypothetical protein
MTVEAAMTPPRSGSSGLQKTSRAIGSVDCEVSLMRNDLANRKSFRAEMNENTPVAMRPGRTSGKRTCQRNRALLAPSMYAASSSASGTAFTNPRSIQIAKNWEKAMWGRTSEPGVFS